MSRGAVWPRLCNAIAHWTPRLPLLACIRSVRSQHVSAFLGAAFQSELRIDRDTPRSQRGVNTSDVCSHFTSPGQECIGLT